MRDLSTTGGSAHRSFGEGGAGNGSGEGVGLGRPQGQGRRIGTDLGPRGGSGLQVPILVRGRPLHRCRFTHPLTLSFDRTPVLL